MTQTTQYVHWLDDLTNDDVALVGGKNASLGEMIQSLKEEGVRVPGDFATTAEAYPALAASRRSAAARCRRHFAA